MAVGYVILWILLLALLVCTVVMETAAAACLHTELSPLPQRQEDPVLE